MHRLLKIPALSAFSPLSDHNPPMYNPTRFQETRPEVLSALMQQFPLATIITSQDGDICADHIPLQWVAGEQGHGKLIGHVARANPIWKHADGQQVLVIFQGPQAYISPNWYASKAEDPRVVPTWNYAVVHVQGNLGLMSDLHWMRNHVSQMTDTHEPTYQSQWKLNDAPEEYVQMMLNAIVGIEIRISSLVGKFKLSQNRSAQDYAAVLDELKHSSNKNLQGMAKYMKPD